MVILLDPYFKKNDYKILYYNNGHKKEIDYFGMTVKYLLKSASEFIKLINEFEHTEIAEKSLNKLKTEVLDLPDFSPEKMKNASRAA